MRNFFRLAENVMTMPVVERIVRSMDDVWEWGAADGYLRETQSISLRRLNMNSDHQAEDDAAMNLVPAAKTMALDLMSLVRGSQLGGITLVKLVSGAKVLPHDNSSSDGYYTRYHVVLQGLPGSQMNCGKEAVQMKTGDIWWVNTRLEHSAFNNSSDDRLHMTVDVKIDT